MKYLSIAFNLLTTLPVRAPVDWQSGDTGRAAVWYPFVGLVIGALVALAYNLLHLFFPPVITAALTLTLWVILTGGLHLDGLADCCDGLLHASNPEKRLEIMKDSHMGAFGGIGLVLILLLKVFCPRLFADRSGFSRHTVCCQPGTLVHHPGGFPASCARREAWLLTFPLA